MTEEMRPIVLKRGENDEIRITPKEYKGREYVDIRIFYMPEDDPEMRPTRKGIVIYKRELGKLTKALTSLYQEV